MLTLALANLRHRPSAYAGTGAATIFAAALASLCAVLFTSALAEPAGPQRTGAVAVFATMGAISLFAAVFVLASTVATGVLQRQVELSLLRTIGATPRQVRRLISREATVVAVGCGLFGAVAGRFAATATAGLFARAPEVPDDFAASSGLLPVLIAYAGCVATVFAAAYATGRRAGRGTPGATLADSVGAGYRIGAIRAVIGVLTLAGAVALLVVAATTVTRPGLGLGFAFMDSSLGMVAIALLGPVVARPVLVALRPLAQLGSAASVAYDDLYTDSFRLSATVTPVLLLVTLTATMTQAGRATSGLGVPGTQLWSLYLIVVIAVGFVTIAITNTTVMTVLGRRSDLDTLRRVGATPGQLVAIMRWEAVLACLCGAVLGVAVSLAAVTAFTVAAHLKLGDVLEIPLYLELGGGALLVAILSSDLTVRALLPRLRAMTAAD